MTTRGGGCLTHLIHRTTFGRSEIVKICKYFFPFTSMFLETRPGSGDEGCVAALGHQRELGGWIAGEEDSDKGSGSVRTTQLCWVCVKSAILPWLSEGLQL